MIVIADLELVNIQHFIAAGLFAVEMKVDGLVIGHWTVQPLHLFQLLAAGLSTLSGRCPDDVTVYEILQFSNLFLLLVVVLPLRL